MDEKIVDRCLRACNKTNRLLTTIIVATCAVIFLQGKKIERLNDAITSLKQSTGDQTPNA